MFMDQTANLPQVAFLVNLGVAEQTETSVARMHHLARLFCGHRVPATWIVENVRQANLLFAQQPATAKHELALAIDRRWFPPELPHARFRSELISKRQDCLEATSLIAGDPQLLRPRAEVLAECGILGILSNLAEPTSAAKPRALPCGLWQLEAGVRIPLSGHFTRWFRGRRLSVKQLIVHGTQPETTLVMIESAKLGRVGERGLRSLEKLLLEVSWAASRNQLVVSTTAELLAELTNRRTAKPQRSILKMAA